MSELNLASLIFGDVTLPATSTTYEIKQDDTVGIIPDLVGGSSTADGPIIRWANVHAEESWKFYLDNDEFPGIKVRGMNSGTIEVATDDTEWIEI